MDYEDQILKGTNLITNIKKQRFKMLNSGWTLKNTIQKCKTRSNTKNQKLYMEFIFKNMAFFEMYDSRLQKWKLE